MPHYMFCDENTSEQRHVLGLLIVRQQVVMEHSIYGGFSVVITLPIPYKKEKTN